LSFTLKDVFILNKVYKAKRQHGNVNTEGIFRIV
jgi:hypothetical protein